MVAVPPEEFLISRRATSVEDASFVCHRVKKSVSDLILEGYPKSIVEELPSYTQSNAELNEERIARFSFDDDSLPADEGSGPSRKIWLEECYIHLDYDGDGIAELRKITKGGNIILDNEEIDSIPFSTICPLPIPHKFHGMSIADTVQDIQLIKSTIVRNLLDNMYLTNNSRYAVLAGQVELDDLLSSKPGGIVRMRAPGAVTALPTPQIQPFAFEMVKYLDQVKEERSGVSKMSQGLNPDVLTSHVTSGAISAATESAMQRVELIARIFAETGIKDLFRRIFELTCKYQDKERVVELNNQYISVKPTEWRNRYNISITVGLGTGSSDQQIMMLNNILERQLQAFQLQGGQEYPMVSLKNIYNSLSKIIENAGLKNVENYFVNPDQGKQMVQPKAPPPPTPIEKIEFSRIASEEKRKLADLELQLKEIKSNNAKMLLENEIKMKELELKYNAQIDSAQIKAEADLNKMLVAESTKDFRDAQQSQQNLEQQIESLNERPGKGKAPTGSKPIQQG